MSLKVVVAVSLAIIAIQYVSAAPHPSRRDHDLRKSFAEFLQQDKEMAALLHQHPNLIEGLPSLSRHVRQAEDGGNEFDEQDVENAGKNEGFFDRAAKFVMEVLQRFLKWINTDN